MSRIGASVYLGFTPHKEPPTADIHLRFLLLCILFRFSRAPQDTKADLHKGELSRVRDNGVGGERSNRPHLSFALFLHFSSSIGNAKSGIWSK